MRQKIASMSGYGVMAGELDGLGLLRNIRDPTFNFQSQTYLAHSLHESKRRFYSMTQGKHVNTQAYLEQFQNMIDVIQHTGGIIGQDPGMERAVMIKHELNPKTITTTELDEVRKEAQGRILGVAFLLNADRNRFGKLVESLQNDYLQGQNNYPNTIAAAYNLLINW